MADQAKTTVLTKQNIQNGSQAIKKYIDDCLTAIQGVQTEIENLRKDGFIGDASDGFNSYVTTTINNLKNSFYDGDEALMPSLKKWIDSYLDQLISQLDPNLKSQNENIYNEGK